MLTVRSALRGFTRSFKTTAVNKSDHGPEGFPGANLPFSINNRYKLCAVFMAFFGSGFSVPFVVLRYHLTK
ncbi:cytochrome c oxidase subunit 7C, mitochondrial [Bombus vosnesenskii]|uniref:Cytochrome c oxidase subunit 7C, mitochondrial n=1 Tax=Bombus vosnesenskii TaxID=207650 RepID=A0A6J3LIP6_9HYME|nr:cytochrome c oxidase subunit 7C, mitochondrial [Bombus vosnesenskii]